MAWIENNSPAPDTLELSDFPQAHWWWLLDQLEGENSLNSKTSTLFISSSGGARARDLDLSMQGLDPIDVVSVFQKRVAPIALKRTQEPPNSGEVPDTFDAPDKPKGEKKRASDIHKLLKVLTGNEDIIAPVIAPEALCAGSKLTPDVGGVAFQENAKVIIGVIDDGIAIANKVFRAPCPSNPEMETTRIASLWQQDAQCIQGSEGPPFGRTYTKSVIDGALSDAYEGGQINEVKVYRALELGMRGQPPGRFARNVTHGTHVAGLAAGVVQQNREVRDEINLDPDTFPIIAVNLPTSIVQDTAGSFMASAVVLGIQHILEAAKKIGGDEKVPVVINLSFSLLGSGMGGATLIAKYMDEMIEDWKDNGRTLIFVLPAGNNFEDALVADLDIPAKSTGIVPFEIAPDNRTSTFVEFVVETQKAISFKSGFSLSLESKADGVVRSVKSQASKLRSSFRLEKKVDGQTKISAGVYYGFKLDRPFVHSDVTKAKGREVITLALPPHVPADGVGTNGTAGQWFAKLHNHSEADVKVTVHLLRNDDPLDDAPRQSAKLLDGDPTLPNPCKITPLSTLNALAASKFSIVAGASYANQTAMSPYSSSGPITALDGLTAKHGVTLHAPADRNQTERGLLGPGAITDTQNGRSKRMSGTSVAAPLVTRWCVNFLAQNETATTAEVLTAIEKKALRPPTSLGAKGKAKLRAGKGGLSNKLAVP